jgi:hypothetical protein
MNVRITIILLVVLLLLGGYVLLTGSDTDEAGTDEPVAGGPVADGLTSEQPAADDEGLTALPDETPVLGIDRNTIRAIEVENAEGDEVRVELQADGWQIVGSDNGLASSLIVTRAITDIAQLGTTRIITPTEEGLAPFGLDDPVYVVRLYNEEGEAAQLNVGDESFTGTTIYVQRGNEPIVYLVNRFRLGSIREWFDDPPLQTTPVKDFMSTPGGTAAPGATPAPESTITPTVP